MDPRIPAAARLQQQKNYPAAEAIYRQILANQPANADALLLLGLLFHETGRDEQAVEPLQKSIAVRSNQPEARRTLAAVLQKLGRLPEAIVHARELARIKPTDAEARYAVAQLMLQVGDAANALGYAKRASELQPRAAAIFVTLSRIYLALDDLPNAMTAVARALMIKPDDADAIIDRANLLRLQGRLEEAVAGYEAGLKVNPKSVSALNNLGSCYLMQARAGEAIRCFEAAAQLLPSSPKPRNNIGAALKEAGQVDASIPHFLRAIELDANYADSYCNLGAAYAAIGEQEKAIVASREALRIKPDFAAAGSNLLLTLLSPTNISAEVVFREHVQWAAAHANSLQAELPPPTATSASNQRITVAYVSPDFREHSVRYFIEPVLAHHDRSKFEIVCYATGKRRDEVTDRLMAMVDQWHPVAAHTDRQLAELIRSHEIDILVDLAGHTSDNRLLTFARRPARIQATYLGYPTTTGLSQMDYRLSDWICDPPGAEEFYTEKLIRLPHAFFVYSDNTTTPIDPVLPADRNGYFTFASFNAFTKINDQTLNAWAQILNAVPRSKLLLKSKPLENPSTRHRLITHFAARGIAADRLDLRAWVTMPEHTAMLGSGIDLMLDAYPYNGHTTSCQSLWMGVPMVTFSGQNFRSRVGESILHHLDLMQFVGKSWEEYVTIAAAAASGLSGLRSVRPTLRDKMQASSLCDAMGFTREIEAAYESMLQRVQ